MKRLTLFKTKTMWSKIFAGLLIAAYAGCAYADGIEIHRVVPSKIIYRVNERGVVDVVVGNPTASAQSAEIRLVTRWDMDGKREIGKQDVTLAPGEVKTLNFAWDSGTERYGRSAEADLIQNGKIVATRSEFFNVINEWWRVNLCGRGGEGEPGLTPAKSQLFPLRKKVLDFYHLEFTPPGEPTPQKEIGPFMGYGNHDMAYASAPSIFGALVPENIPEDVTWYSGSGSYPFKTSKMRTDAAWRKKWGYKCSMYSDKSLTGPVGFEIARRHPEWVARTETGAFAEFGYASPSPIELAKPPTTRMSGWFGLLPDLYNSDALRFGIDALVKSIKEFGWDGIFWDGCGYVVGPSYSYKGDAMPNGQDPEEVSAHNIRETDEAIWKEFPEEYLWYNGATPADVGSFYPSGNGGGRKGKMQMIVDSRNGSLKELQPGAIANPLSASHCWRSLFEVYLDARDSIRKKNWGIPLEGVVQTGFLFPEGFRAAITPEELANSREQWAWSNHAISFIAAAQLHLCGGAAAFRPMLQVMTRYSRYFWDENIRIVEKAYKHYEVDSLREIWWEDSVYERKSEQGKEIIFNLINSPDTEKAHMKIFNDPKVADDVELTCLDVKSTKGVKAWAVRPYDYESGVLEPTQEELKPEIIDGKLVMRVPPFRYFTLVVIKIPKE